MNSTSILTAKGAPEPSQQERIGEELSERVVREAGEAEQELYRELGGRGSKRPPRDTSGFSLRHVAEHPGGGNDAEIISLPREVLERRLLVAEALARDYSGLFAGANLAIDNWTVQMRHSLILLGRMNPVLEQYASPQELCWIKKQLRGETSNAPRAVGRLYDLIDKAAIALHAESRTTPLTGLGNRRALNEDLGRYVSLAERTKEPLLFVLADANGLKQINDTYGHPVGDRALKKIAEVLNTEIRDSDRAYNWGGDEFSLVLPYATDLIRARARVESIRSKVGQQDIPTDAGALRITVGVGMAGYVPSRSAELGGALIPIVTTELFRLADAALYKIKGGSYGKEGSVYSELRGDALLAPADPTRNDNERKKVSYIFMGPAAGLLRAERETKSRQSYGSCA